MTKTPTEEDYARLQAERDRAVEACAEAKAAISQFAAMAARANIELAPGKHAHDIAPGMFKQIEVEAHRALATLPPPVKEAEPEPVAWTGRTHDLKTWPTPFDAVAAGLKTWELRLNDRDYQVGDRLRLRRWVPVAESYSGEETTQQVVWLMKGPAFGLPEGYVIMSLAPLAPPALQARVEALEKVVKPAETVMRYLEEDGPDIVPHLLDSDDNPGQRLRDALSALTGGRDDG